MAKGREIRKEITEKCSFTYIPVNVTGNTWWQFVLKGDGERLEMRSLCLQTGAEEAFCLAMILSCIAHPLYYYFPSCPLDVAKQLFKLRCKMNLEVFLSRKVHTWTKKFHKKYTKQQVTTININKKPHYIFMHFLKFINVVLHNKYLYLIF